MKINVTVDCTPEEARAFLGLPDVTSVNETLVEAARERIRANMDLISPEFLIRQWSQLGGQAGEQLMQMMTAGVRAAASNVPPRK